MPEMSGDWTPDEVYVSPYPPEVLAEWADEFVIAATTDFTPPVLSQVQWDEEDAALWPPEYEVAEAA